jgi:transposase-like protein
MAQKRTYPARLKTSIVLSNLRGEASIAELARQHGIHESLIQKWKQRFLEAGAQGLQGNTNTTKEQALEAENDRLKRLLGEKELELDLAKKIRGL